MSLGKYRDVLNDWFKVEFFGTARGLGELIPEATPLINDWWQAYKDWEAKDRFLKACRQNRMVIRQSPITGVIPPPNIKFTVKTTEQVRTRNPQGDHHVGYTSNVGLSGLRDRMDPTKFDRQGTTIPGTKDNRGKYVHGLHDLSSSLLNPGNPSLSDQCRWKDDEKKTQSKFADWCLVFIPVAKPEDVRVFNTLNMCAKVFIQHGLDIYPLYRDFCAVVRFMSKRMTRIKYAQESDMGAGFVNKELRADALPKFRYGAGDVQEVKGASGIKTSKYVEGASETRAWKALNLDHVLRMQTLTHSTSNEVIVRVRERKGDRFPLCTHWSAERKGFVILDDLGVAHKTHFPKGIVPDAWETITEVV